MLIEQEIASIMHFLLDAAGNPNPYYYSVPEQFKTPAVHFPSPEITTGGETFRTYRMEFAWFITFHDETTEAAYALAHKALTAIMRSRMLLPLIAEDGTKDKGYVRIVTASAKPVDVGVCQLYITFVSRRPYDAEAAASAENFVLNLFSKSSGPASSP